MGDTTMIERVAGALADEMEVRRFFHRRSIDKSCYEIVHDTDPDGPITDTSLKVISKSATSEEAAEESARLASLHLARVAIEAMREPTIEMILACAELPCSQQEMWERSIEAALKA